MSLSHGPSDFVLFGFLLILAGLPTARLSDNAWYLLASCFGGLVAYFEFLTGGLPLGWALLLAGVAVCARRNDDAQAMWRRSVGATVCFLGTAASCFATKVVLIWFLVSPSAPADFLDRLLQKMSGEAGGWLYESPCRSSSSSDRSSMHTDARETASCRRVRVSS
jgi:hypothetical protein